MMVPYVVFASMATSDLLAAAAPYQDAITEAETALKAAPQAAHAHQGNPTYTTYYNTCRFHQQSQARSSTRKPPWRGRKNIPRRST